ncbi:hypothetical protein [Rickettsia amblyommatis]|uniref:Uncharacterized protein n=1 Tax=Rickettsia amblyommatis str. Ac/Pa TaxID=1359164 RepID=A0A0F3N617_RICAM|nr:hypothetical protein [Rickettsia amblyommatis]ALA61907.1 hypothetical protein AL573_04560 [Rickettsia amblyommatis]KJV62349.1 hypothetical protein APHACPA_1374 [Rickettsia amblyommatis str. Ac/Pa]
MPTFVKAEISTAAWRFYAHPTVAMGICVGAALAYSPENTFELLKNTTYTGIEAAKFAYENTAGINGIAGLAHLVYDNLSSYSGTPQVDLAGSIEIPWADAVA